MVAVDEAGRPAPVPPLQPQTPDDHRRFSAAQLRRQLRAEVEQRARALQRPPGP
jgi:acyl-CoA hydrolase